MKAFLLIAAVLSVASVANAGGKYADEDDYKPSRKYGKYEEDKEYYKPQKYASFDDHEYDSVVYKPKKKYGDRHDYYEEDYAPKKYGKPRYESESFDYYASNDGKSKKPEPYGEEDYLADEKSYAKKKVEEKKPKRKEEETEEKYEPIRKETKKPKREEKEEYREEEHKSSKEPEYKEDEGRDEKPKKHRGEERKGGKPYVDEEAPEYNENEDREEKPKSKGHGDGEGEGEGKGEYKEDSKVDDSEEREIVEEKGGEKKKDYGEPRIKVELLKKCGKAMFPTPVLTYLDAKKFCAKQGGSLLALETRDFGCVNAVFTKLGVEKPVWVGSWNSDNYRDAGIAMTPSKQGGSIAVPREKKNIGACELVQE